MDDYQRPDLENPRNGRECTTVHLEALSLRLYNAQTRQWSLNFSAVGSGTMGEPAIGQFTQGRGEFVDREMYDGRLIDVRFVITQVSPDTCRFEQSFSSDGGKTWEVNWIAIDTRQWLPMPCASRQRRTLRAASRPRPIRSGRAD